VIVFPTLSGALEEEGWPVVRPNVLVWSARGIWQTWQSIGRWIGIRLVSEVPHSFLVKWGS